MFRKRINELDARNYWDELSDEYNRITRISFADFHYGPQIPGEKSLKILPKQPRGSRALELGCGEAHNSIWLANRRGYRCGAFDISFAQVAKARKNVVYHDANVRVFQASFLTFRYAYDEGACYDLIHSSHAMEFAENPKKVLADMVYMLKPGGWMMISTVHPLFNGAWVDMEDLDNSLEPGVTTAGLFLPDYFEPPDDVRTDNGVTVISRAYSISTWFKWFRNLGLSVEDLREPPAVLRAPYTSDDWEEAAAGHLSSIPSTVIFLCRKPEN